MTLEKMTAIETIKAYGLNTPNLVDVAGAVNQLIRNKGYSVEAINKMAQTKMLGRALTALVIRDENQNNAEVVNYFARLKTERSFPSYTGSVSQNARIDLATSHGVGNTGQNRIGRGTAQNFTLARQTSYGFRDITGFSEETQTPIALVGFGAAGIIIGNVLSALGLRNITAYEKQSSLGIWNRPDIYNGSRNNPFDIRLLSTGFLNKAPGEGREVRDALQNRESQDATRLSVESIKPGHLGTKLILSDKTEKEYPIVINCAGLGKPNPLSNDRMTTHTTATASKAIRWQKQLTAEEVRGKFFVFVGLGNSTAEMIRQLHKFQDQGIECDYRILTHYPVESLMNPDTTVETHNAEPSYVNRKYRLFRDLSNFNLVDYQGDLPESRYDYFRALNHNKILSDVRSWEVKDGVMTVNFLRPQGRGYTEDSTSFVVDSLYVLTGYHHTAESLAPYGCSWDSLYNGPRYDYDGELQDANGQRIKGYFGFGAVLETSWNPNAIVIPGMIYRIGDLLFSVMARVVEAQISKKAEV